MIVKFQSVATADVIMFGDVARRLLEALGKEPTARGVFTPEEYPGAVTRLNALVEAEKAVKKGEKPALHVAEVGVEPHELIGLGIRARPLIQMFEQAGKSKKPVTWEAPADFFTAA